MNRLQRAMVSKNYTVSEIAELISIDEPTVKDWISGKCKPLKPKGKYAEMLNLLGMDSKRGNNRFSGKAEIKYTHCVLTPSDYLALRERFE